MSHLTGDLRPVDDGGGGNPGRGEGNKAAGAAARLHPQAAWMGPDGGLTVSRASAYRWPVTWLATGCRVSAIGLVSTGAACPRRGSCRGWAVPAERPRTGSRRAAVRGTIRSPRTPPHHEREAREQAYVPAEQPSSPQGARLPPADAHTRRSLDPVQPSPQGPQEPGRLTARARGTRRCSPLSTASPPLTASAERCARGDAPAPRPSWSTSGWIRTRTRRRHRSGSRSARPSATPSRETV